MTQKGLREIILDTETTGLSPAKGDRIIEIGCLEMIDKKLTGKQFHCYINPEFRVSDRAYEVHGLSNDFLQDKSIFLDIVDDFMNFLHDSTLVIHNAPFDMRFLHAELEASGHRFRGKVVDTLSLARSKYGKTGNSLEELCARLGIDVSNRVKHGALIDVELLAQVYIKLVE